MHDLRQRLASGRPDAGQITLLVLGLFMIVLVLVLGAVDVTAAQLGRMRLLDAADSIALGAADSLSTEAYSRGLGEELVLTDSSVRESAQQHLSRIPPPAGLSGWELVEPTGSPDGGTAVVTLRGRATLPMSGWILDAFGGGVTITVESRARAPLS